MKSKLFNGNYVCVACGGTLVKVSVCVTLSLTEGSKLDKIDRIFKKMNKIVQNWRSIHQKCHFMTTPIWLQVDKQLKMA
jgi:hypothetical protein